MKVFIVHAHHEPHSFNAALTQSATEHLRLHGHEVIVSDLHAMGWDPVSDRRNFSTVSDPAYLKQQQEELYATEHDGFVPEVQAEMDKLRGCDALVFQFPLWWFGLPAILKGWVDRVFAMGVAYGQGRIYDKGVFVGKRALLSLTTGGPAESYIEEGGQYGGLSALLYPINHGVFEFTGMTALPPFVVYGPVRLSSQERAAELARYCDELDGLVEREPQVRIG